VGGWTTTVVAFLFMFDFSTFPGGLGKWLKVGVRKYRRWGNRGLVGFDEMPRLVKDIVIN